MLICRPADKTGTIYISHHASSYHQCMLVIFLFTLLVEYVKVHVQKPRISFVTIPLQSESSICIQTFIKIQVISTRLHEGIQCVFDLLIIIKFKQVFMQNMFLSLVR